MIILKGSMKINLHGKPPVTGVFPWNRPVTRSFDALFDLHLSKLLSKQSRRRWFETPSRSLWRHYIELSQSCLVCCHATSEYCPLDMFDIRSLRHSSVTSTPIYWISNQKFIRVWETLEYFRWNRLCCATTVRYKLLADAMLAYHLWDP